MNEIKINLWGKMKINCDYGFYKFFTNSTADLMRVKKILGIDLAAKEDYFTFAAAANLPTYSLENQQYGGLKAKASVCGSYGEIFRQNGFVFNLAKNRICSLEEIGEKLSLFKTWCGSFNSLSIPQAGGFYNGKRVLSFSGIFDRSLKICEIYGVSYE